MSSKTYSIDAVITWVNSNDRKWQKKINKHSTRKINWKDKKASTRYNSINEIEIALKSIIKFAPFVKNIFLVTDQQKPKCFNALKKLSKQNGINLELIDHTIIFRDYPEFLPTFNSCSIITMLYKIPNLAERFIIFNDDTFLMRKTSEQLFFLNGLPVIRARWSSFYENKWFRKIYRKYIKKKKEDNFGYKKAQQKSAKILGFNKYLKRDHTPVPILKSTLENYFKKENSFLENNIKHRFRNKEQFMISSLSNHLEALKKEHILKKNYRLVYFQSYKPVLTKLKLFWFSINTKKRFMCFQGLELADKEIQIYILNWLNKRLEIQ